LFKKRYFGILIFLLVALSGCLNDDEEELKNYVNSIEDLEDYEEDLDHELDVLFELIEDGEPEEVIDQLEDEIIPIIEDVYDRFNNLDLKSEDVISLNELIVKTHSLQKDTMNSLLDIFILTVESYEKDDIDGFNIDDDFESIEKSVKEHYDTILEIEEYYETLDEKYKEFEYDQDEVDLLKEGANPDDVLSAYGMLVMAFTFNVIGEALDDLDNLDFDDIDFDDEEDQGNQEVEEDLNTSSLDDLDLDALLEERESHTVVYDANLTIEDSVIVQGRTNLPEGAVISLSARTFGSSQPAFDHKMEVDEDGSFGVEIEIDEEDFSTTPFLFQIAFTPDYEYDDMYGEYGELIDGPFARKYASIKRTRSGAIGSVVTTLEKGVQEKFTAEELTPSSDQGDLEIWMELEDFQIHDEYYDIVLNSNLIPVVDTRADIEVPGYTVAGYTARGTTRDDGSVRMQVPRLDEELEDEDEVSFIIEALANSTIESEDLYGTYGDKFEGELTEKTTRGQKIVYKFYLQDAK